ncbi:MAG: DUF5302 domain-containing protein [Thermocrispum sp.]
MAESKSGSDEVKDRVREALERKQAGTKAREGHEDGRSKVNNTHGPVGGKREFRRKSG